MQVKRHVKASYANPTPVTDGKKLIVSFGSEGLLPVIYKHLVIVQCDTQKESFIAAFNLADGKRVWQTPREEDSSWSTPTIYEGKDGAELITSGTKYYRGYDPLTGKELWRLADGADVKIPTPIAANDLYFLGGGTSHARHPFYAVRAGVKGEIKPSELSPPISTCFLVFLCTCWMSYSSEENKCLFTTSSRP